MGISNSKLKKLHIIDYGSIVPLGLYEKNDGYDLNTVQQLIVSKRLSPFYKGLSNPLQVELDCCNTSAKRKKKILGRKRKLNQSDYILYLSKNQKTLYDILYGNSVECPICFLYYPANINFARCCDQPICTECFVQIKNTHADYPTATGSDIVCPYCMTENFGIIYHYPSQPISLEKCYKARSTTSGLSDYEQLKRKSIDSNHPDVVLSDHVRSKLSLESNDGSGSNSLLRGSSIQLWFQSRNATSPVDRYVSTVRLDDVMLMNSIRQSLIDKGIYQGNIRYSSRQVA